MNAESPPFAPASHEIIHGGGEMGKVVRAKDWSKTPLGPIESWPQSLRTTVNLCLASNFPISIAWGPHRVQIYNDGYWPICAAKHPHSMGQDFRECWFSAWPAIGEAFERASAGETAFLENTRMFVDRNGFLEETFFTFSFSPIRDETGAVGGLFHPVIELTQQTLGERRLKVLRDVSDSTNEAASLRDAMGLLAQAFAQHKLDLPFVLLYQVDADGQKARLAHCSGFPAETSACPPLMDLQSTSEDSSWPLAKAVLSAQHTLVENLEARLGPLKCGPYPEPPQQAFIVPLRMPGHTLPLALLVAGVSARRPLDAPYRIFYEMLGVAVASALAKAQAYEQERKRAEALAELDRTKTIFFSNISHEFRTPLTLLLGPLEEELRENPGSGERLAVAHRNALRLLKLVNTLLDFSRIEAGRIDAVYEPTDLPALTEDLASVFRSAVEKAGLRLIVDCPPLRESMYIDREMWEKIVLNLLSNALKFTFHGEIRVTLHEVGNHVELSVSDTGVGIPEAELPRIFERFHRVRGAQSRSYEGSGIGLALVQELAKLHGGEVSVQSMEGRGTTFTVSLQTGSAHLPQERIEASHALASSALGAVPFVEEALRWTAREEAPGTNPLLATDGPPTGIIPTSRQDRRCPTERSLVLFADDNSDMRDYVCSLLASRYEVIAVADGEAALAALKERKVDLVLSDVMMPRLDGFGLLRALRNNPVTQTLPVILLSARAGEEARVEGLEVGADDYLSKPFSARELLARVEANLAMARMRGDAEAALLRAVEQAKVANTAKSVFLANMSHELRTPLNAVLGFSSLMRNDPGISKEQRETLDIINRSGENLLNLVNDVLDMAKIEAGRIVVEPAPFDLGKMARNVTDLMRQRAEEKNLLLLLDQSSAFPRFVCADEGKLRQVLINLIGNAIKYTESGGVTLRLGVGKTKLSDISPLVFEIEDTGVGIAAEDQSRIFEPFIQVGKPSDQKGTGLGLAITRQYVEIMGGTLRLESTPGKGSLFRVEVPVQQAQESEVESTAKEQTQIIGLTPDQPKYRILIVEDEADNQLLLRRLIEPVGFQVRVAGNGSEGVEVFKVWHPHLIWMDRRMPEMDGLEATRRIRTLDGGQEVKIVGLTASVFADQREEVLAAGIDDFISKPYRPAEVFDAMARHLGVRYTYRETPAVPEAGPLVALNPESLASLPKDVREELAVAVVGLDVGQIAEVIHRISALDPALAIELSNYTNRFAYTPILQALRNNQST